MEAEFERTERRREKERKETERLRKVREEQEARGRKIVEEAEKKRLAALQLQREREFKRREREEEEALTTGGIRYSAFLKPVPLANLETDKVRLPPSTLEALLKEGAIEDSSTNKVLTFELALLDDVHERVVSKTHCGVLEFTAEEGTIELPIKAAVSLGKEMGEGALSTWKLRARYVAIDRYDKIRARVQPLGKGFHLEGAETANIDLKSVLERVLSKQTTISQGDWIPMRHEGKTYTLAVRELWPDQQAVLLNTDVEIDLMPSEEVTLEKERLEKIEKDKQARLDRAKQLAASLPMEPATGGGAITIRARLPDSLVASRKFDANCTVNVIFAWAESLLGKIVPPTKNAELEIVQSFLPGQPIVVIDQQQQGDRTLREIGFGRSENVNFRWRKANEPVDAMDVVEEEKKQERTSSGSSEEWTATRISAESRLDTDLLKASADAAMHHQGEEEEEEASSGEISSVDMFKLLVSKGADKQAAAHACQKFLPTLRTLKTLSLLEQPNSGSRAVELVEKYKGSTGRVADAMLMISPDAEQESSSSLNDETTAAPRWGEEIAILESMFTGRDRQELIQALDKHGGSVQKVVNELLG